jgi:cytochrome P450 family 135
MRADLPPGPRTSSLRQLYQWSVRPLEMLDECRRQYGEAFTLRFAGYGTFVMLTQPDAIREVFRGDPAILHSGEANAFLSLTVGEHSILVLDDEAHRQQRQVQLPAFKGERMRSFFQAIANRTDLHLDQWPIGSPFAVDASMRDITLGVILEATLGLTAGAEFDELARRLKSFLQMGATKWTLLLTKIVQYTRLMEVRWLPYAQQLEAIDARLFPLVEARRQHGQNRAASAADDHDILDDLLAARHENGTALTDQEIRDAIMTTLLAGHETTATALAWAFEQILSHPPVAERIRDELQAVTGGQALRAEQLPQLEYLDAVIKEVLRYRVIVPFVTRLLKQPFTVGGREYPAGIQLAPCIHLVHRRPDLYECPDEFRPERFLERRYSPYEWLPFGGGNRLCLGMQFALFEMRVVLATVLGRAVLERPADAVSRVSRRGVVLAPSDGTRVVLRER